ncbi:MAG TPA: FIST N-terminal domain-containing protein [Candidatus Thermoplasmatota archaeon]|nr:FIST N-terminal domain-containing protein [Candidatus Thermoplasmatota archaeon]
MQVEQRQWTPAAGWSGAVGDAGRGAPWVLVFGSRDLLAEPERWRDLRARYPDARLFGCSTAGEIHGTSVSDDSLVATAVRPARTRLAFADVEAEPGASEDAGARLAKALDPRGLAHVFVVSDGQVVNGSELVRGLTRNLPPGVAVTGGLAGDGARFERTLVLAPDGARSGHVSVAAFYGDALRVSYGSLGGWDPFGPARRVTSSEGNVLYELDGKPALDLYKRYLGEHAASLPASGLLFPLSVHVPGARGEVVRTILNVDEATQSLVFAGDVPEGSQARLMKANFDRLVDGAHGAAATSGQGLQGMKPDLAVLISCVGRKLVLRQRTEEELEAVASVLGGGTPLAGFYSYGEICPAAPQASCTTRR